jgi:hypothetical protein
VQNTVREPNFNDKQLHNHELPPFGHRKFQLQWPAFPHRGTLFESLPEESLSEFPYISKNSTFHFHTNIIKYNFVLYILILRESLHPNLPMTSYRSFGLLHLLVVQLSFGLQHVSLCSFAGTQFVQNSKGLTSRNNEGNPSTLITVIYALHVYFYRNEILEIARKLYDIVLSEHMDEHFCTLKHKFLFN